MVSVERGVFFPRFNLGEIIGSFVDQQPTVGFKVDAWVKGKSEAVTKTTDAAGLVTFDALPFPDMTHQLVAVLHYYRGKEDDPREIDYPFIDSDAYRLKDTQYIPNTATPEAQ